MAKKKEEKLDALIFIDTNIFLDFYRIRKSNVSLKYLEEIEKHFDLIITTSQVEMEFKKNRQSVILESIGEVKKINNVNISVPAILADAKAVEMIEKSKKNISKKQKDLRERIEKILKNPTYHDPVFKSLQKLFSYKSDINLNRANKVRFTIRNFAKKRFILGYPPRKKTDNSIGDAVNWEWIIRCAENTGKHIIIVTRDSDFGCVYDNDSHLNDWLKQEFKQRISQKRKIVLTDKLHRAFQLVEIPVTKEMIEEEENVISKSLKTYNNHQLQEAIKRLQENLKLNDWQETIRKMRNDLEHLDNENIE
ncbi:PIN domain-containing protein [Flagellimonas sp.]|uniref:PIN domain-containing protein n=1 Tax=Flagellimonas sp. TaxID=2058762 RepID=UPI003C7A7282